MKKAGRKYPQGYIRASKDFDENGIISSVEDMTDFINAASIIDAVIERVNDADYDWEYNTPEKFAKACKNYLTKNANKLVKDYGYKLKKDLNAADLISGEIWNALEEQASSGDFDVDACSDVYGAAGRDPNKTYNSIKFGNWTASGERLNEAAERYLAIGNKKSRDELVRYVRYAISEAENVENKMVEYKDILQKFNSSSKSTTDVQQLIDDLDNFKFSQN